jgi:hypothetical protein
MRAFFRYFLTYWRQSSRPAFWGTLAFLGVLTSMNYTVGIEARIKGLGPWWVQYGCFAAFYLLVLAAVWGMQRMVLPVGLLRVLGVAALYFAAKMVHWEFAGLSPYFVVVLQWPGKLLLLFVLLWMIRKAGWLGKGTGFGEALGLTTKGFRALPYFGLLLLMAPLVALASTQPDFLRVYPKVMHVTAIRSDTGPLWPLWLRETVYELSYGLDFLSIELFFRGLLVIGIVRFAGEKAILPMAAFYCTIHFGKPLAECITSFFGGIMLGVLAYRTRTVIGGLIVHLGLAWMMEVGGWVGHL